MAFVKTTFVFENTSITVGMIGTLKQRVKELRQKVMEEKAKLEEWLETNDEKQVVVELKKQQFRKMEKWNAVFSFRKASHRRRGLLSQIRKTKKGKK